MANEVIWTYASPVTLEASGAEVADDAFGDADDADLADAQHGGFPLADFVLKAAFGGAVAAMSVVNLYRRDLNIDSTNDAIAPSATYPVQLVGNFLIPAGATAAAYYPCADVPLVADQEFFIENKTGQTLSAAWTLKATPKTYEPAA